MLSINPVPAGFQGDCNMTAEKTAESKDKYKMEVGCFY
jgi:hypothetical protein